MEKEFKGDLILLRGIPGSGKTTLGHVILKSLNTDVPDVISADDFFLNEDGEYIFDSSKLREAHNQCQVRCSDKMRNEIHKIVVANTFTQEWEMMPYYEMADRYNYRIHTIIVENRHDGKNIHQVPDDKLRMMKERFEIVL